MAARTALLAALLFLSTALHAQLAAWDFFGENTGVATSAAEVYDPNMDASNLVTRGAGAAASSANNSFRTTGFQNNGISTANTDYFQCTLSAATGYLLSLSTIDARFAGTASFAAAPGVSGQFAYSLDGTNFTLIGAPAVTIGTPATLPQINLTGIPALQNLADGTTVTFRYYASGQTATGGWGFNSPTAGQYGLAIGGSLIPLLVNTSVAFNGSAATVLESVGTTPINVSISNPSPGNATTADVVLTSGNAARINNYTTQTVTFPASTSADQTVTVTVTDNGISDGNAVLVFQLQNVTGGQGAPSAGAPSSYTLNITDNDVPPTVSVNSVSFPEANSGTTNALVSVTMNAPPASTVVVSLTDALTGSATAATDYGTFTPASLVFLTTDVYPLTQSVSIPVFGDTDVEPNETVNYTVSITSGPATLGTSSGTLTITNDDYTALVINEVDADSPGADVAEFVELYGPANASLNGLTVVFFNGSNDLSYASFDLDGYSLDANGFFVLGNAGVTGVDLVFASNLLQNGADAVAVYFADATSFPTNTPVTTSNLVDAMVYDTDDADDAGLLVLLNPGQPQVNENGGLNGAGQSSSRVPDGGVARNTDTYAQQSPTPDGSNTAVCDLVLQPQLAVCNSVTAGPGDTYTVSIPYTGVEPGITVVNNSGSGSVGGDDPALTTNGTIVVSGISEANNYSITFSAPCNTLTVSGTAPTCEPLPQVVINEVDYDNPGTDNAEWIELRNNGPIALDLAGFKVELVNGSGGGAVVYKSITLPAHSLAPGAYYVIGNNLATPNLNLLETPATDMIQNGGPDAVGLRDAANNLLDAVSYEGTAGAPYFEGAGSPVADPGFVSAPNASVARFPDGTDTNNNLTDLVLSCSATPGAPNNAAVDTDGDTFADCLDGCPNDPLKTAPGLCGCGVAETDSDGDFVADCVDGCPLDPTKIVPGACGCGIPDVDSDGDLTADCNDGCPLDPLKIAVGACGCGVADVDTDLDGTADCNDGCPLDPLKVAVGQCGCGVVDTDSDNDGAADCNDACPTDANKIAPGICGCGVADTDSDSDGTANCNDGCPNDPNKVAPGICGCDVADTDSDSDGTANCNDACPNDPNKIAPGSCGCGVADTDTDGDGTADCIDSCPTVPGGIGAACDDGNANTSGDVLNANCLCAGTPIGGCTQNEVTLSLTTDNNGAQTSWEIVPSGGGSPACTGGGYASNSTITATCCLPNGCYNLRVLDSFGDGLNSGPTGGWVLRDANNERLLDNAGDGIWTGPVAQAPEAFCLPLGTDRLTTATCDQETVTSAFTLQIVENTAVTAQFGVSNSTSGYQFWIYNPDGSYTRKVAFTHAAAGSSAPTGTPSALRSSFLRLNTLTTNPVPSFTLLNVRVRARVAGVYAPYGPACRMKVDPTANCQATQLTTTADPVISCGATGLQLNGINQIHAVAVPGANRYQFRFTRPGYTRNIATNSRSLVIAEWNTNPLQLGQCYDVVVRVSFDNGGTWCAYGNSCQVCMAAAPPANGSSRSATIIEEAALHLWPNPNRGEQLYLTLDHVNEAVTTATVDIFDLVGQKVTSRTIAVSGSTVNTVIDLDGSLSSGIYVVNLTAGEHTFTQRLVIQ